MTQRQKVLRLLKDAGRVGVHTFELRAEYIGNPSQRIAELEADGYVIRHTRERLHGKSRGSRYTLISQPQEEAPAYDDTGAPLLFDASTGIAKPRGAYDETEAA